MNPLRKERKNLGLTQAQAAVLCGVSRRTYQTYEETESRNRTYDELLRALTDIGVMDGSNLVLNPRWIKRVCAEVLPKYPFVESVYLFGSYARGQATGKSDVDLLFVCPPVGMKLFEIAPALEEKLHKTVDIHTHRQLVQNEPLLAEVLREGIKIYG